MSIQENVNSEIKSAMRSKDRFRLTALKYIKSLMQNNSISEKPLLDSDIVLAHHKKMTKALALYKDQALEDLKKEINIIGEFLPKAMSEDDIKNIVDKYLSLGDFGSVMKAVKAEVTGPFDGKLISTLVKTGLS